MRTIVALIVISVALAGCSGGGGGGDPTTTGPREGKGAIEGLLIDDLFRPIAGGRVFILDISPDPFVTNGEGVFFANDVEPGSYRITVQAEGHEAAPMNVDVAENEVTEVRVEARRVMSTGGTILTREYSVFVPCAASAPAISITFDCTGDQSGDTYRAGFDSDFQEIADITYLVTEMKANRPASPETGAYKVVVRERGDGQYYGSAFTVDGDYIRIVMPFNGTSEQDTEDRNSNWTNDRPLETLLFPQGSFKQETQDGLDAACEVDPTSRTCFESRGLGAQAGVRGQFIQSLFIGEPEVDITTYCVLC